MAGEQIFEKHHAYSWLHISYTLPKYTSLADVALFTYPTVKPQLQIIERLGTCAHDHVGERHGHGAPFPGQSSKYILSVSLFIGPPSSLWFEESHPYSARIHPRCGAAVFVLRCQMLEWLLLKLASSIGFIQLLNSRGILQIPLSEIVYFVNQHSTLMPFNRWQLPHPAPRSFQGSNVMWSKY